MTFSEEGRGSSVTMKSGAACQRRPAIRNSAPYSGERWREVLRAATRTSEKVQIVAVPRFPFDTFHANIEEKDLGRAIVTLGRHIKHVHTCENDRGIPGTGHIEWPCVFAALKQIGYDGWVVIESFGFAIEAIAAAACIWRDIAPTPEVIAWEGVKFLKKAAAAA